MICLSQFPEVVPGEYDFIKDIKERNSAFNEELKVAFLKKQDKGCIDILLYDIKVSVRGTTCKN